MSTIATHNGTSTRLEFRLRPELKDLIVKAATASGKSITDYSVSALVETATRDLREHETRVLSDRDRDLFLAILDSDMEPNEAMKRAAARYKGIRA